MAEDARTPAGAGATDDQHQDSSPTSVRPDTAVMSHPMWTQDRVEERLHKAVALQTALKTERLVADIIAGRSSENRGIIGGIGGMGSECPADGDHGLVAHAAEALSWLRWLEPDDADLVRARLSGALWKSICWRFDISRPTADRRWRYALALIAWHLNGHAGELKPSLRALLGMRRASQGNSSPDERKRGSRILLATTTETVAPEPMRPRLEYSNSQMGPDDHRGGQHGSDAQGT